MTENIVQKTSDTAGISDIISNMVESSKATNFPMSQPEAQRAFNLVKSAILTELEKGHKIQFAGFLTIAPVFKPSRKVFNIATRQPMETKAGVSVVAKVGSKMREIAAQYDENIVQYYKDKYESKKS